MIESVFESTNVVDLYPVSNSFFRYLKKFFYNYNPFIWWMFLSQNFNLLKRSQFPWLLHYMHHHLTLNGLCFDTIQPLWLGLTFVVFVFLLIFTNDSAGFRIFMVCWKKFFMQIYDYYDEYFQFCFREALKIKQNTKNYWFSHFYALNSEMSFFF